MRQRLNLLVVLTITAAITYYSVYPVPTSGYSKAASSLTLVYHVIAYFALAAALLLYFHDTTKGHIEAIIVAGLFGATLELVQYGLPSRFFSFLDITVNMLGASLIMLDHRSTFITTIIEKEDQILATVF